MKRPATHAVGLVIGWRDFAKINAVEGIRHSKSLIGDLKEFERRKTPAAERRRLLAKKYGGAT